MKNTIKTISPTTCLMFLEDRKGNVIATTTFSKRHEKRVGEYRWNRHIDRHGNVYVVNWKIGKLHRFLLNAPKEKHVDHIDHNTLNNRDKNIRLCTQAENNQNLIKRKDNKSGTIGVLWNPINKNWRASIRKNGVKINLGSFRKKSEAIKARKEAEL